ncbi:hypothetical protein K3729_17120 [Rhodobacteraceae bacterium S2214]|nr:hypothetical protein K3729_17120 [Rhodobacteraceae bacterium S2214]
MNLIDFAKQMPKDQSEQEFVDSLKQLVDLGEIENLSKADRDALFDTVQYLTDFTLFVREAKGELGSHGNAPYVEYSGPFIPNALTRPGDAPLDLSILQNFGVGAADKYLGSD